MNVQEINERPHNNVIITESRTVRPAVKQVDPEKNFRDLYRLKTSFTKDVVVFTAQISISLAAMVFFMIMLANSGEPLTSDNLYLSGITLVVGAWLPQPSLNIIKTGGRGTSEAGSDSFQRGKYKNIDHSNENLNIEELHDDENMNKNNDCVIDMKALENKRKSFDQNDKRLSDETIRSIPTTITRTSEQNSEILNKQLNENFHIDLPTQGTEMILMDDSNIHIKKKEFNFKNTSIENEELSDVTEKSYYSIQQQKIRYYPTTKSSKSNRSDTKSQASRGSRYSKRSKSSSNKSRSKRFSKSPRKKYYQQTKDQTDFKNSSSFDLYVSDAFSSDVKYKERQREERIKRQKQREESSESEESFIEYNSKNQSNFKSLFKDKIINPMSSSFYDSTLNTIPTRIKDSIDIAKKSVSFKNVDEINIITDEEETTGTTATTATTVTEFTGTNTEATMKDLTVDNLYNEIIDNEVFQNEKYDNFKHSDIDIRNLK